MSNNDQHTEIIIRYLDGELAGVDLKRFEELLREDDAVRQELDNLILAQKAIASYGLKTQVSSVHAEMMQELKDNVKSATPVAKVYTLSRTFLKIAASLLFFLLSFGAYQYATVSPEKLYGENYHPYNLSVSRGGAGTSELEQAYINGKKDVVINLFEKMDTTDNKITFLAAQSYLQTHQPKKAIQTFNKVLGAVSAEPSYKDDAEYYLALSYIENNQPQPALKLFEKIYDDKDHLYHDKVRYWTLLKLKLLALKTPGK